MRSIASVVALLCAVLAGCHGDKVGEVALPSDPSGIPAERDPAASTGAMKVTIHQTWRGFYHLSLPSLGADMVAPEPQVIRDPAAWSSFIDGIPKKRVQMKQPAPPSRDPLLKRPSVDFERHMVLVAFRVDVLSTDMAFESFTREGGKLRVRVHTPEPGAENMMARPTHVGAYVAVAVDRFDGEVVWGD